MINLSGALERVVGGPVPPVARRSLLGLSLGGASFIALAGVGVGIPAALAVGLLAGSSASGAAALLGRPPRARKDSLGFLISIAVEDDNLARELRADFVRELQDLAADLHPNKPLQIVQFEGEHARRIVDCTPEILQRIVRKARCELGLFGYAKTRDIGNKTKHVIDPRFVAVHAPIDLQQSDAIGKEISQVLPRRMFVDAANSLLGFGFASNLISIAAQYTIALVASATEDYATAEQLFLDLQRRVRAKEMEVPSIKRLAKVIPDHLCDIYGAQANRHFWAWNRTRDKSALQKQEIFLDKILLIQSGYIYAVRSTFSSRTLRQP